MHQLRACLVAMPIVMIFALTSCDDAGKVASPPPAMPSNTAPSVPHFGDACAAVPADPANPGSFEAMATKRVASAVGGNASMSVLTGALKRAGLTKSLNAADALTVFAPTNGAFDELPTGRWDAIQADKKLLVKVLSRHVVPQRLDPQHLSGKHSTLAGDTIIVTSDRGAMRVNGVATVVCANVQAANAVVYFIDRVLADS